MNPSFSIISTLIEAAKLCLPLARPILVLALICGIPSLIGEWLATLLPPSPHGKNASEARMEFFVIVPGLALSFAGLFVDAGMTAALLGLLKASNPEASIWATIKASIQSYAWPLFILAILLSLIACMIMVPAGIVIGALFFRSGGASYVAGLFSVFTAILYLVFVKYALADPLIVVESMQPLRALVRSWQMTRGRFWYVLGCYVFLSAIQVLLSHLFRHYEVSGRIAWIDVIKIYVSSVIGCYWIVLAWVMYNRIRAAEAPASGSPSAV